MNKKILAGIGGTGMLAVIAFGVFGVHTAFIDNEVSEGGPEFASGAQNETTENKETGNEEITGETEAETAPDDQSNNQDLTVTTEKSGEFSGLKNYEVSGGASVLTDGNQRFLSLDKDFETSNGPDLKVYLRADSGDFVNLGGLKGNIGDQNYEIPADVDLEAFTTVEIWCERFSVGFGEATLAA